MKPITLKLMALLLAVLMAAAVFGGCKKEEETVTTAPTAAPTEAPTATPVPEVTPMLAGLPEMPTIIREDGDYYEFMDDITPVTLTFFYNAVRDDTWTWGENRVEQHITELTGVILDGRWATDSEGNDLTLMLASGEKLPDIINGVACASPVMTEMIDGDVIYPLNELIDQYCPLMWTLCDAMTISKKDADGNLWYLPKGVVTKSASDKYAVQNGEYAVRGDIVDALGNPPLNTLDDMWAFLELWEQNKDQWPEIKYPIYFPALVSTTGNGEPFYNGYGGKAVYAMGGLPMIYDHDTDTVHFWVEDDYGYKALKEMFKLAQAGYVTQESFAVGPGYQQVASGSMLLYTGENVWAVMYNTDLAANIPGAFYERIAPITASADIRQVYGGVSGSDWNTGVVVPKDCSNPERTIDFLEFLQTEYGSVLVFAGVYGEHFVLEPLDEAKGTVYPKYIGEAAESMDVRFTLGIYNHWKHWINSYSDYDLWAYTCNLITDPGLALASSYAENDFYEFVASISMDKVAADDEMALLRNELMTIIGNYQTQMILAADETAFDALYNELLTTLEANGLQQLKDFVVPLCNEVITQKEAAGVTFK